MSKKERMKKTISKSDYYAIVGLVALADKKRDEMYSISEALEKLLDEEPDGHVGDTVWSGGTADGLLSLLRIKVKK